MRTTFSEIQLADPRIAAADPIIRRCVHCGFCLSSCPTYTLLGDERDSPRGRIYLIKEMFERGGPADPVTTHHLDRCLSCFACMTACPSGVDYMHLSDLARAHIEETAHRPVKKRILRRVLSKVLPDVTRFRIASGFGRAFAWMAPFIAKVGLEEVAATMTLAKRQGGLSRQKSYAEIIKPEGRPRWRVALLLGCAQRSLRPSINDATLRVLSRHGVEVVLPRGFGCCGALQHHLGQEREALAMVKQNVDVLSSVMRHSPLDAIIANTSGCGTVLKDYGHMLARDMGYRDRAEAIGELSRDISEFLADIGLQTPEMWSSVRVAYHAACSLQHGQQVREQPPELLRQAGFTVLDVPEGHLCCGSAGTYNILQPEIADRLRARKLDNIRSTQPDVVATGNVGCISQLKGGGVPIVHTIELLDWATGGPCPAELEHLAGRATSVHSLVQMAAE